MWDAVELTADVIRVALPSAVVDTERLRSRSLSEQIYVWVQETSGGRSPLPDRLDVSNVNVVVYAQGSRLTALDYAQAIQHALRVAWYDQVTYPHGHILRFATVTKPYVQLLAGMPASTFRVSATYALSVRPPGL